MAYSQEEADLIKQLYAYQQRAEQAEATVSALEESEYRRQVQVASLEAERDAIQRQRNSAMAKLEDARGELEQMRRALAEAGRMWEKAKQERADAQQLAADFSRQRDESLGIYAKKNAQIAALRAALVRCKPSNADPPCDCCEPCGAGFISRCECDNRDDACNAQTWCVMMSNFNAIEGVLSDTAAAAEAHDAAVRSTGYRDGYAQALREVRWALGSAHEDAADEIVAKMQSEAEAIGEKEYDEGYERGLEHGYDTAQLDKQKIRKAALEEAAQICDREVAKYKGIYHREHWDAAQDAAIYIRALAKEGSE